MPPGHDHVDRAVAVDVHEEDPRMVMRRGQAEVRRLDGVERLVPRDETARRRLLEKMRPAALDRRGAVDRSCTPGASTRRGGRPLEVEVEEREGRDALRGAPAGDVPRGGPRAARSGSEEDFF